MRCIYVALQQTGYHSVSQIIDYVLTEDPTYATNYNCARHLIRRIDWHELLWDIVALYFSGEDC